MSCLTFLRSKVMRVGRLLSVVTLLAMMAAWHRAFVAPSSTRNTGAPWPIFGETQTHPNPGASWNYQVSPFQPAEGWICFVGKFWKENLAGEHSRYSHSQFIEVSVSLIDLTPLQNLITWNLNITPLKSGKSSETKPALLCSKNLDFPRFFMDFFCLPGTLETSTPGTTNERAGKLTVLLAQRPGGPGMPPEEHWGFGGLFGAKKVGQNRGKISEKLENGKTLKRLGMKYVQKWEKKHINLEGFFLLIPPKTLESFQDSIFSFRVLYIPGCARCTYKMYCTSPDFSQEEMEVEGLDGATASLIFFVVVAILVFGCLQVAMVE